MCFFLIQHDISPLVHASSEFTKFSFVRDDDLAMSLIERGARVNNEKYGALFQAIIGRRLHLTEFFLKQGADIEQVVEVIITLGSKFFLSINFMKVLIKDG